MKWKFHVQERPATIKCYVIFLNFPQSMLISTSLFFNKLEEDNICLMYNSTLRMNPSLIDALMILAKVKLNLVMMDNSDAI